MGRTVTIFVGGTGRSGTSQIATIIGQHPSVWRAPDETRFLVDPGGLEEVVRSLSTGYTPFHAMDSLARLRTMLTENLAGGSASGGFGSRDLRSIFGAQRYADWAEQFLAELTWYSFDEGNTHRTVGRYFSDRTELVALCRSSVDRLFTAGAADHGKVRWCEKTPDNTLFADFLWELFPQAQIVHIVRHPVQVAASHLSMDWAPDDIESVCNWLEPLYHRWLAGDTQRDPRCVEVRLEDLAADWPAQRAQLFARLGLPDAPTEWEMTPDRVIHFWSPLSADDEAYTRKRLGFAIDAFGYR
jgi:omega-hydroxy-beta-dihydromenaquinone-9 sulfotransferase